MSERMRRMIVMALTSFSAFFAASAAFAAELISHNSSNPPGDVEQKYVAFLKSKGVKIFSTVDHSAAAQESGPDLPPTRVIIFGNPKLGTALMKKAPSLALDLPMKVLIEANDKGSKLSYRPFAAVLKEHGLEDTEAVKQVSALLEAAATAATK